MNAWEILEEDSEILNNIQKYVEDIQKHSLILKSHCAPPRECHLRSTVHPCFGHPAIIGRPTFFLRWRLMVEGCSTTWVHCGEKMGFSERRRMIEGCLTAWVHWERSWHSPVGAQWLNTNVSVAHGSAMQTRGAIHGHMPPGTRFPFLAKIRFIAWA